MGWLTGETWPWLLLAFVLGVVVSLLLILRKVEVSTLTSRSAGESVGAGTTAAPPPSTSYDAGSGTSSFDASTGTRSYDAASTGSFDSDNGTGPGNGTGVGTGTAVAGGAVAGAATAGGVHTWRSTDEDATQARDMSYASTAGADVDDATQARDVSVAAGTVTPSRFGAGTVDANSDGSSPDPGYTIKGNANSMLFHTTDSPSYARCKAEVWFDTEDNARAAGFRRWNDKR